MEEDPGWGGGRLPGRVGVGRVGCWRAGWELQLGGLVYTWEPLVFVVYKKKKEEPT